MFSLYKITTYPRKSKREGRPRCRGWCRNCTQTGSACRLRPPPSSLCFRTCILMSKTLSRNSESEDRVVCVNCPWELQKKYQEGSFCGRLLVLAWCIYYGRCNRSRRKCTRKFPPLFIIFILNTILKYTSDMLVLSWVCLRHAPQSGCRTRRARHHHSAKRQVHC